MKYNWQYKNWPKFGYDADAIDEITLEFASETGEVKGIIDGLSVEFQQETVLQFMIDEAMKTSEIEGEYYSRQDVMCSIKNRLGISPGVERIRDINARGIAELMVEVRQQLTSPLTEELIRDWHESFFLVPDLFVADNTEWEQSQWLLFLEATRGKSSIMKLLRQKKFPPKWNSSSLGMTGI